MSYRQRERKRRMQAAAGETSKRKGKGKGKGEGASAGWWPTLVVRDCACARCGMVLRVGREMVYRRTPREARCVVCAEGDPGCRWRPSLAWEKQARKKPRRR